MVSDLIQMVLELQLSEQLVKEHFFHLSFVANIRKVCNDLASTGQLSIAFETA